MAQNSRLSSNWQSLALFGISILSSTLNVLLGIVLLCLKTALLRAIPDDTQEHDDNEQENEDKEGQKDTNDSDERKTSQQQDIDMPALHDIYTDAGIDEESGGASMRMNSNPLHQLQQDPEVVVENSKSYDDLKTKYDVVMQRNEELESEVRKLRRASSSRKKAPDDEI